MEKYLRYLLLVAIIAGCASSDSKPKVPQEAAAPTWIHEPVRTVDNGYIIYVGIGEDTTIEKSRFKAEAMAIQDLVNECSLAPLGARIEDEYDTHISGGTRSYAKIAVEFPVCDEAKAATNPEAIRRVANVPMTEELKRYQDLVAEELAPSASPEQVAVAEGSPAPEGSSGGSSGGSGGGHGGSGYGRVFVVGQATMWNPGPGYAGPPPQIVTVNNYFYARQGIAVAKQNVILAPNSYPPGSPQATNLQNNLNASSARVRDFEATNPQVKTWNKSWSQAAPHSVLSRPIRGPVPGGRPVSAPNRGRQYGPGNRGQGRQPGNPNPNGQRRRRKGRGESW